MENNCTGKVELVGDKIRFTFEYDKSIGERTAVRSGVLPEVSITGANMAANFWPFPIKQPDVFDSLESWEFQVGTCKNVIVRIDNDYYWVWGSNGYIGSCWFESIGNSFKYLNEYLRNNDWEREQRRNFFKKIKGEVGTTSPKVNFTFIAPGGPTIYRVIEKVLTEDDVADINKSQAGWFRSCKRPKPIVGRRSIMVIGGPHIGLSMCNPEDTWDARKGVELAALTIGARTSYIHANCMEAFDKWQKENGGKRS